jgi:hypothetical protein
MSKNRNKKVAIIGRGTAGALAALHFNKWAPQWDIDWYYDPHSPTQAVGEGATLALPDNLYRSAGFTHSDLGRVEGTIKTGIHKTDWGCVGPFTHNFTPPSVSMHFNAKALQSYLFKKLEDKVNVFETRTSSHKDLDADFIMDCSGSPKSLGDEYLRAEYIAVNSVHVTQCYWSTPAFNYTIAAARPYGWVFLIPLNNRCSVGYMFNNNINSLEEVTKDVQNIFEEHNLIPSEDTQSFSFNNYYRRTNYTSRAAYSGNASFFLEPMEATSIGVMDKIQRTAYDIWNKNIPLDQANYSYTRQITEVQNVIMLHYFAGSSFDTEFWDFAKERGKKAMENAATDPSFVSACANVREGFVRYPNLPAYGLWEPPSFLQNIQGLGVKEALKDMGIFPTAY